MQRALIHSARETSMHAKEDYPVVAAVIEILTNWWKRNSDRSDLVNLADADVERVAKDLGMSVPDLRKLDRSCAVLLLPKMIQALSLDPPPSPPSHPPAYPPLHPACA